MQHQDESQKVKLGKRNQVQKVTNCLVIRSSFLKREKLGTEIRAVFAKGWGWGKGNDCKNRWKNFLEL